MCSHPALISTPATTWMREAWTQQVRKALEWLKFGITILETVLFPWATELLGIKPSSRRHCMWAACPMTRGQSSLMIQVASTGDPKGTTELDVWIFAHGCMTSSNSETKIGEFDLYRKHPELILVKDVQGSYNNNCLHSLFLTLFTTSRMITDTHVDIMMTAPVRKWYFSCSIKITFELINFPFSWHTALCACCHKAISVVFPNFSMAMR